jgi:feruloyl esterase
MGKSPWDWRAFDFDRDAALAAEKTGAVLDATDPDLGAFRAAGGKLIVYHGWNDQVIFPGSSVAYYEAVAKELAPRNGIDGIDDFMRLFMVPGMTHCRGGVGTDQFDMQAAIETWVEQGDAPDRIAARRVEDGNVTRTRPLCPYPATAQYDGSGSTDDAANFVCRE